MSELNKEWFEKWFDTNYYHLLYQSRNDKEARDFISNLVAFLQIPPHSKVIDIACGRGRHAIYLHEKGLKVTGLIGVLILLLAAPLAAQAAGGEILYAEKDDKFDISN